MKVPDRETEELCEPHLVSQKNLNRRPSQSPSTLKPGLVGRNYTHLLDLFRDGNNEETISNGDVHNLHMEIGRRGQKSKGFRAMTKNGRPRSVTDIILDELGFNVTTTAKIVNYNVMFFWFVGDFC